jgi:hypothetical protein
MAAASDPTMPPDPREDTPTRPDEPGSIPIEAVPPEAGATAVTAPPEPTGPARQPLTPERLAAEVAGLDRVIAAVVLVLVFLLASFLARNSDLWMHLASGRLMAQGEYVFGHDPFAYTTEGQRWVNHSWLFDRLLYAAYQAVGNPDPAVWGPTLVFLKALLVTAAAAILLGIRRRGQGLWLPAVCTAVAVFAMSSRMLLQPVCFSYLFLAATVSLLHRADPAGDGPAPRPALDWRFLVPLPFLFALWVNLDDWFLLGPLMVACYLVGQVAQAAVARNAGTADGPTTRDQLAVSVALVAGLAACLANPYGIRAFTLPPELWTLFWGKALQGVPWFRTYFFAGLSRDTTYIMGNPAAFSMYLVLVALGAASFAMNWSFWRWWRAVVWVAFFLLSARLARFIPFFAVVAAPITALNLQDFAVRKFGSTVPLESRLKTWSLAGRILTILAGLGLAALAWPGWLFPGPDDARRTRRVAWAVEVDPSWHGAAQELARLHEAGVLGPDAHGFNFVPDVANYCAWFCPGEKGFFDYRFPLFPEVTKVFTDVQKALYPKGEGPDQGEEDAATWQGVFRDEKYHINHLVVSSGERDLVSPVVRRLWADRGQWTLLYMDGRTTIFGWTDPLDPAPSPFEPHRLDLAKLAFGPDPKPHDQAPGEKVEVPQRRSLWDRYLHGPPPRPLEIDETYAYLEYFNDVAQQWPAFAVASRWVTDWAGPAGTACLGTGMLPAPYHLAVLTRMSPSGLVGPQDVGPPAALILAVRAARRAVADNREDADCYLALAQAYKHLWSNQEERWAGGRDRTPLLQQLRQGQVVTALQNAAVLRPDSLVIHLGLAQAFQELNYVDLELDQWNECQRCLRQAGQGRLSAEQYNQQLDQLERQIKQREDQTKFQARRNDYELTSAGRPPRVKAELALQRGLVKEAITVLREADPTTLSPADVDLMVRLLLMTGQADEVEKAEFEGLSDWYRVQLAALAGDYATAQELVRDMHRKLADTSAARVLKLTWDQTFQPVIQPRTLVEMYQALTTLYEQADLRNLRGILALEAGDSREAARLFRQGVRSAAAAPGGLTAVGGLAATSALEALAPMAAGARSGGAGAFQPGTDPVARHYLRWLEREGN